MNRDETMLAVREMLEWGNSNWADGVEVQYAPKQGKGSRFWTSTDNPLWNWEHYDYRIKPTLRPWTADEVPLGAWMRSKRNPQDRMLIHWVSSQCDREMWLDKNEHSIDGGKTWKECGVYE